MARPDDPPGAVLGLAPHDLAAELYVTCPGCGRELVGYIFELIAGRSCPFCLTFSRLRLGAEPPKRTEPTPDE